MRKKLLVTVMALIVCGTSMPSTSANAKSVPENGIWGAYWPGWYNDNGGDTYNQNGGDGDGHWYDTTGWYDNDEDDDEDWYDTTGWYDNDEDDNEDWYDAGNWYDNDEDDDEDWYDADGWYDNDEDDDELTIYDIAVNPKKKEIKKGKSFYISLVPADKSEWEDFTESEWDEICEENIESIEYSSTKKSVASVNSFNGKVKARKKGTAVIKTTINLANEESVTFKTKVTVKK